MPADRWQWVQGLAHTAEVDAVLDKQDRGDPLTSDERRILSEARAIINSEVRGWERGEPWDRDEDATPTPTGTPVPAPTGTPVPGSPEMPPSPAPVGNETLPNSIEPPLYGPSVPEGWTPPEPPGYGPAIPEGWTPSEAPAARPLAPGTEDSLLGQAQKDAADRAAAAAAPKPAAPAPAPKPAAPTPAPKPAAPAPAPAPKPAAPPPKAPPASIAPPPAKTAPPPLPFERDDAGAALPRGRFTDAISQAGGRPTQRVAERVGREIGEVFRPGDQGGYRGDTGGWRTLAQEAANAWEEQYRTNPNSLKASERAAYERNPSSLRQDILKPDSPFRDYRESWIGAARVGQRPPRAGEFTEAARPYGVTPPNGVSNTTDAGGVPRVMTPAENTRQGAPLPGEPRRPDVFDATGPGFEPGSGISNTTDRGGVPREMTPSENTRPGAPLTGGEPPSATLIIATPDVLDIGPPSRDELTPDSPYVSRQRGRSSPDLMAMMHSDANEPWPDPGARAKQATESQATQEIVAQGRANRQSNREIAETLEMNGFGDADQWENSLNEEDMRGQAGIERRYPPDDTPPSPSMIVSPSERDFYSPYPEVGTPWSDPGDELPINYDQDGYPIFRTRGGDDRTAESQPSSYNDYSQDSSSYEEPSYYDESSYAEDQPQYDDQGEAAYDEPSYDYEYADEYA